MTNARLREWFRPESRVGSRINKVVRASLRLASGAALGGALLLTARAQSHGVLREVWLGIGGTTVADLTNNVNYPNNPSFEDVLTNAFEAPVDWTDNYGTRLSAYVVPPTTGSYVFWISSDDSSTLFLSTDDQPANIRPIADVPSWTPSRVWDWFAEQQSSPVVLAGGQRYFIEALQKEGGGGDNVAVRWQLPGGTIEEPIPASRLLVYSSGPPQINRQPTSTTVMEGETASFSVGLVRPFSASYQWQSNQVNIVGATSSSLIISPAPLAAHGSAYRCIATNLSGSVTSAVATLYVTPDTVRPTLALAQNQGATTIKVVFSEPVAVASATLATNYGVSAGITVSAAAFGADTRTILLTTSPLTFGTAYRLTVSNVRDRAVTPNPILPGSTIDFVASEYAPADIGSPPLAGSQTRLGTTSFDTTGAGTIGGTSDSFHFDYESRTGNFDLQVRVAGVTVSDPFLEAGLMVRETLNANSRFAGVFSSSAQLGCFFEGRDAAGASATTATIRGGFPVNYPQMWLRLQRSSATLTGFASQDGQTWVPLGSRTLSGLPATVYFGLAVASESSTVATTGRFRDIGPTATTATGSFTPTFESLGPSTRRTGMIFSEIMYHPRDRADGRNLAFVELYNARSVFEDLTGWRLSGDIDYRFPEGFRLQAGEFVVVAANPADLQTVYGITNVVGPYTNALPHSGGTLRLRNNADAIRLEVNYSADAPWPAAAAGAGHSLVLARPSYGEDDPQAWAASELVGGSPGDVDAVYPTPLRNVVINELLAHTDPPWVDSFELYNHSNVAVDLSGCYLTDDPKTNKFRIPDGTTIAPRGFLTYDETQLGYGLQAAGEAIYLVNSNATRVIDAVKYGGQDNNLAVGRYPDGAPTFRRLSSITLGTNNAPPRVEDIVINEIMFDPMSLDSDDEYIELYNRTGTATNLSNWKFTDGISFKFPTNTILPAYGSLVVARNAAHLMTNSPAGQLTTNHTVGDYTGKLANGGGHLALARHEELVSTNLLGDLVTNWTWVVVSEARYGGGGGFGRWAAAGGSSLELTDPNADPLRPSNWADSDETQKASWTTVSFTGPLDNGNTSYSPDRLFILMQGPGECLVDDVQVYKTGSTNLVTNGGFESGTTGWSFLGNQSRSTVDTTGAASGTRCLHVRGQENGDTGVNSIRTSLVAGLVSGNTATLTAKVRWLAGWPEVLFRLHGNYLELPARMSVPRNLGTPGLPNSRLVANAGPAVYDVTHTPGLPRASQAVLVTCRASDSDGVSSVQLRYRVDPNVTLNTVVMRDDGLGGDAVAGDGIYSAFIPGQGSGTLIAFRIQATDLAVPAAASVFPAGAPAQECLVRWDDPVPFGNFPHHHLWDTQATENARNASGTGLDNTWRDATLVYGNQRVIYDVGFRDKGSPWHGGYGDIVVATPPADLLFGVSERIYGSTGNGGSEATAIRSQLAGWLGEKLGIPYLSASYLLLYRNGGAFREVMEDLESPNTYYAESWYPQGGSGDLYKVAFWYEFDDNNQGFNNPQGATLQRFLSQGTYKLARYRWCFARRPKDGTANNYTNLFDLVTAANDATANYVPRLSNLADMEEWMRVLGYNYMMGNWDAWAYSTGQNMFLYKQPGFPWILMPWDIDFVFGLGDGATSLAWGGQDPVVNTMIGNPNFVRMLWRAYQDAANGPFQTANYTPQIDARRKVLLQNGIPGLSDPTDVKTWMEQRRAYLLGQLAANDVTGLTITSNGGNDYTSTTPTTTIIGRAPFAAATIEINGVPYPVTWTDRSTFRVTVPLTQATNVLTFVGRDLRGNLVSGATDTITVTFTGAIPQVQDYVVLNEIHYDPLEAKASFIELFNRSANTPFDLSGFRLDGVGYTFPEGALIQPNSYLLLVADQQGFANAYGQTLPVFDVFAGTLSNGGEHLALVEPGASPTEDLTISDVRYDGRLPWPTNAHGWGPSLQLVDPAQEEYRVGNWASTATNDVNRVTPGRANSVRQTLAPFPPVWINEVLPNNITSQTDNAGEHEPWIELYNAGTTNLDLSPFYLTDSYTNLVQWQFPAGTTIGSQQFLLVWADGEAGQSAPGAPHTSFRLNPTNGSVALVRYQGSPSTPAVMDYLDYALIPPDRSFGSYPDGEPRKRRLFYYATPGATNNPAYPQVELTINEFMTRNTVTLADPADLSFEDWFELYNAGTNAVDLTSYTLTDTLTNAAAFRIPSGHVIPPGGFLLVWADKDSGQNSPTNLDLHTNFKLNSTNGAIALFSPDGALVDSVTYGPQTNDVSMGRFPDGAGLPLYFMNAPTPRSPNILAGANRPPVLSPIGNRTVADQSLLTFPATATDPDAGQSVSFSLSADAPAGAAIDPITGVFTWTPTEAQGPGAYSLTVRATDNGTPARTVGERITVTVTEVNRPPAFTPIGDRSVNEGALLTFTVSASDPDLPTNTLSFSLGSGAPLGAAIDPATGIFTWTPGEAQGPNTYTLTVRVTDNGVPPLSATNSFRVTVNEVNNPPVMSPVSPQTVEELSTFRLQMIATDPDTPPSAVVYSFDEAPGGARIDPVTGWITWTPTEAQGPTNAIFIVRATESAPPNPSGAITFSVTVTERNQAPVLAAIPSQTILERQTLEVQAQATDADLPPQVLTFALLAGAPAGASIDPNSGLFTWSVDPDFGAATNRIAVVVADDGPGWLTATQQFSVVVRPQWHAVINEIMYRPAAANTEYVELFNNSARTTMDLGGVRLTGSNLVFNFAPGTTLLPGRFLVVARNLAAFAAAYPGAGPIVGPYSGALGTNADTLRLVRPGAAPELDVVLDEVTYGSSAPWPATANGAASLQLVDATRDNDRVGNWSVAAGSAPQWQFVTATGVAGDPRLYLYLDRAGDVFVDDLQVVAGSTPAVGPNLIQNGNFESPLTTGWTTTANTANSSLSTATRHSGNSSLRLVCNAAGSTATDCLLQSAAVVAGNTYTLSYWYLPNTNGGNLTVRFSGRGISTTNDIFFDPASALASATPGTANSVAVALPEFPTLRINEVLTPNVSNITDHVGEHDPWIELANTGDRDVSLDGLYLTDTYTNLTKWSFPAGQVVPAGGYLVVFADAEPGETITGEPHTSFRLVLPSGGVWTVALTRRQNGQPAVVDYLSGTVGAADSAVGRLPDANPASSTVLPVPTPGAPNVGALEPRIVEILLTAEGYARFTWSALSGRDYTVEATDALGTGVWQDLGTVTASGSTAVFVDQAAPGFQHRFYRVVLRL